MDTPLLTIAEASKKTGRSASTIRRLIHTITETDQHPDRSSVEPTPDQVAAFKAKGDTFTWRIQEDIILREFASAPKQDKKSDVEEPEGILGILKNELNLKNQQIEKQWEVIHALNERLREGNILMGSLQQRLALPETKIKPMPSAEASEAQSSENASKETSKKVAVEAGKTSAPAKAKTGIFGWLKR
jgi:hypothetical protein